MDGVRAGIGLAYIDHPLFTYPEGEDKESLTLLTSLFSSSSTPSKG